MSVESLIDSAQQYASSLLGSAESALDSAIGAVEWAGVPRIGTTLLGLPNPPPSSIDLTAPILPVRNFALPTEPGAAPDYQDISPLLIGKAPLLTATAPIVTMPVKPGQLSDFAQTPPSINTSAVFPEAPSLITPEAPVILARVEPDKPTVNLPVFSGSLPTDLPDVPTDAAAQMDREYDEKSHQFVVLAGSYFDAQMAKMNPEYHTQMAAIENQLSRYLAGGTALDPSVEEAIYNRGRARNDVEAKRVQDAGFADVAARGFTLPNGALASLLARARQESANNQNKTSNEIMVAQAEMEQKNLQFAVTTSAGLRTAMISATMSYMQNLAVLNGQALDYAKSVMSALIEVYNSEVRMFSARLDGYKSEAQVYESLMRGAMAGIEIYKAEIQALEALTRVDLAQVSIYQARIDVLTSMTNMYKTQVDAAVSESSLERLKIDLFQAQVQAYATQVQAKNAEWQGYSAAIGGEEAAVKIYDSQVRAYAAQMQGFSTEVSAKAEEIRAVSALNDARAKQYVAGLEGYKAVVSARGEVAKTELENDRQQILAFEAETRAAVAEAQVAAEYYKTIGMVGVEQGKLFQAREVAQVSVETDRIRLLASLYSANATIHAQLAGSAMAGMNSLAAKTEAL